MSVYVCKAGSMLGGSREMVSLVSQFLPTFLHRALARWSLRLLYQSLTSLKLYTAAWGCDPGVLRSVLLTAVSCNPVFISAWVMLSHEATVLLQAGLMDNRSAVNVQACMSVCICKCELLHTVYSNYCFSLLWSQNHFSWNFWVISRVRFYNRYFKGVSLLIINAYIHK